MRSGTRVELTVDTIRVEPARVGHLGRQVDDVQYLTGRAAEGEAVGVRGDDVGLVRHGDALVVVARPVEAVAGGGDRVRVPGEAAVIQHRANGGRVGRLDREDARGRAEG